VNFQLIGVNHKSAPVEIRERFDIPNSRLSDALKRLVQHPGVDEGLILCTCNRVEVFARTKNGSADLRGFLRDYFRIEPSSYESHLYEFREREAIRHLFRVTSSLDSMIVGEPQILGQVKDAYAAARTAGAVHSHLDQLLTRAFAVAKKVRTETSIGASAVSVASVAVELAKRIFGSLNGKHVYLVGAGKMSELAARHLLAHGAASIFVANRTHERAVVLAEKFHGEAILFEQLYETCDRADIVITSTGAPRAIFRREHGELFLTRRKNRPMFFIDIAVPRDVDPEMNKMDGIFVYDIDDLQHAASAHLSDRQEEANRAEQIISVEVERFHERLQGLTVVPTILSLQDQLEAIRQGEIDRVRGRLGSLSPEQQLAIDALTQGIVNKIMHAPIATLKSAAKNADAATVIDAVRRIFNLTVEKERSGRNSTEARVDTKDSSEDTGTEY
jgi:glutamyl-tRNA reductase